LVELLVAKHRNGRTGTLKFKWIGEQVRFEPILGDQTTVFRSSPPPAIRAAEPPQEPEYNYIPAEQNDKDIFILEDVNIEEVTD
jgi:hypothetical protein